LGIIVIALGIQITTWGAAALDRTEKIDERRGGCGVKESIWDMRVMMVCGKDGNRAAVLDKTKN
jgi:hypothetical protein